MKPLTRIIVWGIASIIGIVAICFVAYGWETQWDLTSGRQRSVYKLCGIAVWSGQPTETILSNWRTDTTGGRKWTKVAEGPHYFAMVDHVCSRIIQEVSSMQIRIADPPARDKVACLVLDELESEHLNYVHRHCKSFNATLRDTQDPDEMPSMKRIEILWAKSRPSNNTRLP